MTFSSTEDEDVADEDLDDAKPDSDFEEVEGVKSSDESDAEQTRKRVAREDSLDKLQGSTKPQPKDGVIPLKSQPKSYSSSLLKTSLKRSTIPADAIIVLKEERASIFHDFLKFVYPKYVFASLV